MQILEDVVVLEPASSAIFTDVQQGYFGLVDPDQSEPHLTFRITIAGELRFMIVPESQVDFDSETITIGLISDAPPDGIILDFPVLPVLLDGLTLPDLLLYNPDPPPPTYNPYLGPAAEQVPIQDLLDWEQGVGQVWEF